MKKILTAIIIMLCFIQLNEASAKKNPRWAKTIKQANNCLHSEDYDCAIKKFKAALKILSRKKNIRPQFQCYTGLGNAYKAQARYDLANSSYLKALDLAEESQKTEAAGITLMRLAEIAGKWGDHKNVRKYLESASDKLENSSNHKTLSVLNVAMGMSYLKEKNYSAAEKHMLKAIEHSQEGASIKIKAKTWNRLGNLYLKMKQLDKAENAFQQGLAINEDLANESIVAQNLNDIAKIHIERNELEKAKNLLERSREINTRLGRNKNLAEDLHLLGVVEYEKEKYPEAIGYLTQAVKIKNKLRETAQGRARRTYLASQINSYNRLIDAYSARKDPEGFLQTFEMSRARQLAETIGSTDEGPEISLAGFQKIIPENTAVLIYSITGKNRIRLLGINSRKSVVKRLRFTEFAQAINRSNSILTAELAKGNTRGFKSSSKKKIQPLPPVKNIMEAITRYRIFLSDPADKYEKDRIILSSELRRMLLSCGDEILSGKKRLIIIPDGPLALIPFETLLLESGKFVVQKYEVGYVQSAGIFKKLSSRQQRSDRLSIIAFGGAEYENTSAPVIPRGGCEQEELEKNIDNALRNRESLSFAYSCLDLASFPDLPGTSTEIKRIGSIFSNAKLISGNNVNEKNIKKMSKQGKLKKAGIIHFAVHGIAVPSYPELSALILTRSNSDSSSEGYLNAAEIKRLNIEAEFVNLSACETGLGALVRGEGVVGLTHAFLSAGADGMSVSLWNVSDNAAVEFMTDMYSRAKHGAGFEQAMCETKRDFIAGSFGKRFKSPYYWAPFVYYGK